MRFLCSPISKFNCNYIKLLLHIAITSMTFCWLKLLDNPALTAITRPGSFQLAQKVPVYIVQSLISKGLGPIPSSGTERLSIEPNPAETSELPTGCTHSTTSDVASGSYSPPDSRSCVWFRQDQYYISQNLSLAGDQHQPRSCRGGLFPQHPKM